MRRLRLDLHVHTEDSYDADEPVERMLERAAAVGLDGVVVTDHDAIRESRRAAALAPSYGLVGLPGVEVSTADGHLLALGVDDRPPRADPLSTTVDRVHAQGGVAVVPHPFQRSRHGARRDAIVAADPDAVEVYNAHTLVGLRNRQTRTFAREYDFPGVGASDAHSAPLVGKAYTELRVEETTGKGILDAIRAGRTRVVGQRTSTRQYVRKYVSNAAIRAASVR
ncbi:histidinol-phosphatase [Salinigranum rubrum]|uniref:Histidinol-phosphatase n=1 Tax=Salinigranum rubrum TaxID=755307 RepID=A0A2I8VPA1_9EURY|nr:PHP domain-containing protein [Salinigranum rubrum]AUV83736.1 histidinol-phosphatase [Salinigranum rubrum]